MIVRAAPEIIPAALIMLSNFHRKFLAPCHPSCMLKLTVEKSQELHATEVWGSCLILARRGWKYTP